jgi:YidC/Oxa1 family membrane protein insertase
MDNRRLFLWGGLALILFANYQAWQRDYAAPTPAPNPAVGSAPAAPPAKTSGLSDDVPRAAAPTATPATPAAPATAAPPGGPAVTESAPAAQSIRVRTDVLELEISTQGGEIRSADLLRYPQKGAPGVPMRLLNADSPETLFLFQWGLAGRGEDEPNHKALLRAAATSYTLADGADTLVVPLSWSNGAGLAVTRTLTLHRGRYAIELSQQVTNAGSQAWAAHEYSQLQRRWQKAERSMWDPETYSFKGPAMWNGHKYQNLDAEKPDPEKLPKTPVAGGWAAALQHHFVAAIVPTADVAEQYTLEASDHDFRLRVAGPLREIAPGATAEFRQTLYVGPKLQAQLEAVSPELDRTADYGRLTIIAKPLFLLLAWVHKAVGNWGLTIILVTFLIKLAFYPLQQTSGRSMARMRELAPRMKAIQERYKDDREQLGKQMMELYKREKANPLAGCLPMVVQMPVFIAFYWVLLESAEMRQAPFMLWVQDLSARDPYFILPAIMAAAMYGQFKLNPPSPDPVQAKVFAFMPLVMSAMMAFLPAGLVLYWITNTGLSIAQQWRINQIVALEGKQRKNT